MASEEDKRTAVNISVTLSSELIGAALAMIALEGAFVTFVMDDRAGLGIAFYILIALTFIAFVLSIVIGGQGVSKSREEGYEGKWTLQSGKKYFNRQAILCFVGILLFASTLFVSGAPMEEAVVKEFQQLRANLEEQKDSVASISTRLTKLQEEISDLKQDSAAQKVKSSINSRKQKE